MPDTLNPSELYPIRTTLTRRHTMCSIANDETPRPEPRCPRCGSSEDAPNTYDLCETCVEGLDAEEAGPQEDQSERHLSTEWQEEQYSSRWDFNYGPGDWDDCDDRDDGAWYGCE
jgi:hypothetical protein